MVFCMRVIGDYLVQALNWGALGMHVGRGFMVEYNLMQGLWWEAKIDVPRIAQVYFVAPLKKQM